MAARAEINRQGAADAADTLLDLQRRYLEAWRDAGQIMVDALQTVARRQAELAEEGLRDLWAEPGEPSRGSSGDPRSAGQLDRVQGLYQRAFGGFQELSGIMLKAQSEAMRTLVDGVAVGAADASRKAA